MADPQFFAHPAAITLSDIATLTGARLASDGDAGRRITGAAAIERARPGDICFVEHAAYAAALADCPASACLCPPSLVARIPPSMAALETRSPARAFAQVVERLYPEAARPQPVFGGTGVAVAAHVDPTAYLEAGVVVEPGAVIGPGAEIGAGTHVAPNAVIGASVRIGRNCSIGPSVTIIHALVGNRVIIHPGTRVGQDGFGFIAGSDGHRKIPQIGRVIIQDDVEIGANTCIDRGSNRDTVIGEGTKIDNLVQIAHNVVIGRRCLIAGKVGISGSVTIGNLVAIGGGAGIADHVTIGDGAQIAASAGLMRDVPAGARWGGMPAGPMREYFRMIKALERLARPRSPSEGPNGRTDTGTNADGGEDR